MLFPQVFAWQSCAQLMEVSPVSQVALPQVGQSLAQLLKSSPGSQLLSLQEAGAGQSPGQLFVSSYGASQTLFPQSLQTLGDPAQL
jgi:hypothetical protein